MPQLHPEIALYCAQTSVKTQVQFIEYIDVRAKGAGKALAVAVWVRSPQSLSLLTPHRGSVMVITDAAGSNHALRGIDATRKQQRLASLRLPGR